MIALVTVFTPFEARTVMALIGSVLTMVVLVAFLVYAIRNTSGRVRRSMEMIFVSFIVGFLGYIGRSDFVYTGLGKEVYVLAAALLVIGLLTAGITIMTAPALDELNWADQLLELYIILTSGTLLYHHEFHEAVEVDEDLAAAGITGIQTMFKEILKSTSGIDALTVGDTHVLFGHHEHFTVVLMTRRPYRILVDKVKDLVQMFWLIFGSELKDFTGEPIDTTRASRVVKAVFGE